MALPKLKHPTFELTVPSTKEKIRYRPFLVKEEKILLLAQQSGQAGEMITAVKQIINNCIVKGDVNVDKSPTFDIEYMFLKLRANSVSEIAKFSFKDQDNEKPIEIEIDLDQVEVQWNKDHSNMVKVDEGISIEMKYPTYNDMDNAIKGDKDIDASAVDITFDMIASSIDKIYVGEGDESEVHQFNDYGEDERKEFLEGLSSNAFRAMQAFFDSMPKLQHEVKYKVGKKTKTRTFTGIADFFQSA